MNETKHEKIIGRFWNVYPLLGLGDFDICSELKKVCFRCFVWKAQNLRLFTAARWIAVGSTIFSSRLRCSACLKVCYSLTHLKHETAGNTHESGSLLIGCINKSPICLSWVNNTCQVGTGCSALSNKVSSAQITCKQFSGFSCQVSARLRPASGHSVPCLIFVYKQATRLSLTR